MSFFTEDKSELESAMDSFKTLSLEKQNYIITNITDGNATFDPDELDPFMPIVEAIRNDMSRHSHPTITSELIDLGMKRGYAALLVDNLVNDAPTIEYQIKTILRIPDDEFKIKIPDDVKLTFVENMSPDVVSKKLGITNEQNRAIVEVFRTFMLEYLRGDASINVIKNKLQEEGLSETQLDVFINTIKINSEHWSHELVFRNTQDTHFNVETIREQNNEILHLLKEINKKINHKDNSPSGQYQK